jgi:hypothetical protein
MSSKKRKDKQKSVQTTHAFTKKPRIDPEYTPHVSKESLGLVVKNPALRLPFKKRGYGKYVKLDSKKWFNRGSVVPLLESPTQLEPFHSSTTLATRRTLPFHITRPTH